MKELTIEEIQTQAIRDYPIGTIYLSPNSGQSYTMKKDPGNYRILDKANIDAGHSIGFLYQNGKWAKIVSKPKVQDEVINDYSIF